MSAAPELMHQRLAGTPPLALAGRRLGIALVGPGQVGSEFIDQFEDCRRWLLERHGVQAELQLIARQSGLAHLPEGFDTTHWRRQLRDQLLPGSLDALAGQLATRRADQYLVIDTTASEEVAAWHPRWLALGVDVITANKRAAAGPLPRYRQLLQNSNGARYGYETTVGAGLPVLGSIRDLVAGGDRLIELKGVLSGSLSWLFGKLHGGRAFSRLVASARQGGLTEPDPRDDLSGMDVARKLVILGRAFGFDAEVAQVDMESLVSPSLASIDAAAFLPALARDDAAMEARRQQAEERGCRLVYTGTLRADGSASARLEAVPQESPLAQLRPGDNLIQVRSRRYSGNPLVIQGPGAGVEVTAAGIAAEVCRFYGG